MFGNVVNFSEFFWKIGCCSVGYDFSVYEYNFVFYF